MLQSHVSYQLGWRLVGKTAHAVEEWYAAHTHRIGHLLKTDLSTAHVLQHVLLDVIKQLTVHSVDH